VLIVTLLFFFGIYYYLKDEPYRYNKIVFASSLPKTGIMQEWGKAVEIGIKTYFNYANDNNLLGKRKLEFLTLDDKYEPTLTYENVEKLLTQKHPFAFLSFVGTPTVKAIMPLVESSQTPFIAPFTGAKFLRQDSFENVINFRSSYKEEIDVLIHYLHHQKKLNKFAVFYQNDDYGEEGYISLIQALNKRNLHLSAEGTYKRNTLSITHAFDEIKDAKPQAILLVGAYKANTLFIQKAKQHPNFKDTIFCVISFGEANAMVKQLQNQTQNIIFSQVVPSYNNSDIEAILQYQTLMQRYYEHEPLGFISLEAFLVAKTVVQTLRTMSQPIKQKEFLHAMKTLPSSSLKEIEIEYKNRQLLNQVYLFEYKNNQFIKINYEN
jgi:ABC-type branched-subunit amino acid transport system substrate-binding protein